jgi:hypothetical protein
MSRDENEALGSRGLLQKEKRMSREDDFDDIMDSDPIDAGQDDTEPLLDLESVDESSTEAAEDLGATEAAQSVVEEMRAPARKPKAKKKKKAVAKPKAKKKVAKTARKPAPKKTAKKKKTGPAKKKKTAKKAKRKR